MERGGPPRRAGAGARHRWSGLRRHVRTFDDVALPTGAASGGALSRWLGDALPGSGAARCEDVFQGPARAELVEAVARYLAFRAAAMPAKAGDGAPPEKLAEMIVANAVGCFGPEARAAVGRVATLASELAPNLHPVAVDGSSRRGSGCARRRRGS